jgi:hypothetical protein
VQKVGEVDCLALSLGLLLMLGALLRLGGMLGKALVTVFSGLSLQLGLHPLKLLAMMNSRYLNHHSTAW